MSSLWRRRELAAKSGPFPPFHLGASPPLIICSAVPRLGPTYFKARKEIDTLRRAFGGTLCSHAYNEIRLYPIKNDRQHYRYHLRLHLISPIGDLISLFFPMPFRRELGAFLNMTRAYFEPLPQVRCKSPLRGERGAGGTSRCLRRGAKFGMILNGGGGLQIVARVTVPLDVSYQ